MVAPATCRRNGVVSATNVPQTGSRWSIPLARAFSLGSELFALWVPGRAPVKALPFRDRISEVNTARTRKSTARVMTASNATRIIGLDSERGAEASAPL